MCIDIYIYIFFSAAAVGFINFCQMFPGAIFSKLSNVSTFFLVADGMYRLTCHGHCLVTMGLAIRDSFWCRGGTGHSTSFVELCFGFFRSEAAPTFKRMLACLYEACRRVTGHSLEGCIVSWFIRFDVSASFL